MAEASAVCLEHNQHKPGLTMKIQGDHKLDVSITWKALGTKARASHNDLQDATEDGATGIACGLVSMITEHTVIQRSVKGTGFDYWCGEPCKLPFERGKAIARLEVSGILDDSSRINSRVSEKIGQVGRSNNHLPAIIVVVEFGSPITQTALEK